MILGKNWGKVLIKPKGTTVNDLGEGEAKKIEKKGLKGDPPGKKFKTPSARRKKNLNRLSKEKEFLFPFYAFSTFGTSHSRIHINKTMRTTIAPIDFIEEIIVSAII